ncbi:MAG: hypothetical protein Kow0059_13320 [Candidatus Sumerlaeia bacterium]
MWKRTLLIVVVVLVALGLLGMCAALATPQFWSGLASSRAAKGDWKGAVKFANVALQRNPRFAMAHLTRGIALVHLKRYQDALRALDTAQNLNQNLTEVYEARAQARCALGELDSALADAEAAIEKRPNSPGAWMIHGIANFYRGELDTAQQSLERARTIDASDPAVYAWLARVFLARGEFHFATLQAGAAIDRDSGNPAYYRLRGMAWLLSQQAQSALSDMLQAAELAHQDSDAQFALAMAWLAVGEPAKAREALVAHLRLGPSPEQKIMVEKMPVASRLDERTFNETGLSAFRPHFNLALAELMLGEREKALEHLARSKTEGPAPVPFEPAVALEEMLAEHPDLRIKAVNGKVVWIIEAEGDKPGDQTNQAPRLKTNK